MRRVNLIGREGDQSETSNETEKDNMVPHVNGNSSRPFAMKGKINKKPFSSMIDSGSPITKFTQANLQNVLKADVIFVRPMPKKETFVDLNRQMLNQCECASGKRGNQIARIVRIRNGTKSLIGRDWLAQLNFELRTRNIKQKH